MKFQGQGRVIQTQFLVEGMNLLNVEPTKGVSFACSYSKERLWGSRARTKDCFGFKSSFRVRVTTLAWLASSRVGSSTKAPGPMRDHVLEETFPQDQPTTSMDLILYHVAFTHILHPHRVAQWTTNALASLPHTWADSPQDSMNATPSWCRRTEGLLNLPGNALQ